MPKKWEVKDDSAKKLTITIAEKVATTEQYQPEKPEDSAALTETPAGSKEEIILENSTHIVTITIAE